MSAAQPAFVILTWGCQMNEDDSRQMANLLEQMGYRPASDLGDADVVMLNTCSVREKPERKVMSKLGELKRLKSEKRDLVIGVCGCMAQRDGEAILKRAPYVDLVMGTACIHELPALIERVRRGRGQVAALDLPERGKSDVTSHAHRFMGRVGLRMFVPIAYGCNNFCAYCVVPYARGPERSRPPEEIVAEVTCLASGGCKEVTLIGQNVNSYGQSADWSGRVGERGNGEAGENPASSTHHRGAVDFAGLLEQVNAVPSLERIRFTTSHPKDLSDRLIEAIAELPKVCKHLHLPIQAGDDEVLRAMGRAYTVSHYTALIRKLRERVSGISLTTDVMVGFPGETEKQFENTLRTVERIRFDAAFTFAFNPRPGTRAAAMSKQVDDAVKRCRLVELIALQNRITIEKNEGEVGCIHEVLVEGPSAKDHSRLTGYTRTNKVVNFPGPGGLAGRTASVRVVSAHLWGFTGELVTQ